MNRFTQVLAAEQEQIGEEVMIVGGDYNARIECKESIYRGEDEDEQTNRKSKDKTKNQEEEKLIRWTEERGLYILNGNLKGDEEGEYSQIGGRGISVIDYVIVNNIGFEEVEELEVEERVESDHQPLKLTVKARRERNVQGVEMIEKQIICWNEDAIVRYREATREVVYEEEGGTERQWEQLKKEWQQI